jgi:succinate dehydrogenase/fumarate reductase flavoprotein subunit
VDRGARSTKRIRRAAGHASWGMEADVVVVGYGAAGATAAITAHDAGASVLMLEKAPERFKGGNSRISANGVFIPDDVEKVILYFNALCGPYKDYISDEMVRTWAQEMYDNRAWLEGLGAELVPFSRSEYPELPGSDCVQTFLHKEGPPGQARLWDQVIEPAVAKRNIKVLYETAGRCLIGDEEGRIVGITAAQGISEINIKAKRAVILTCGGFENNPVLVRNYLYDLPYCYPMGTPYNTGDGIRMAMEVGADLWHMNNIAGPYFYFKAPDYEVSSRLRMPGSNYIQVARDGTRFAAEAPTLVVEGGQYVYPEKHGRIYLHGRYAQNPTPVPVHLIFDESVRKAGPVCGKPAGWTWSWDVIYGDIYQWSADNSQEIKKGWIKQASSIGELARKVGLDPGVLEKTVERYNAFCHQGKDEDFNRHPDSLKPLSTPPFCIMELSPTLINTQGGPRRNEKAQIVDTRGKPIPRLYSAGELGSIHSYLYQGGGNLGECFAFGRIAGRNGASEKALNAS